MGTDDAADVEAAGDESPELATLGSRAIAHVIDVVLLFAVLGGAIAVVTGQTTATGYELTGGPALLWFVLSLAYFVVLESRPGQTVGKHLLGIAVRSEDGRRASLGASLVRNLLRIVDVLFFYAVGLVLAADSERNQRFGDRIVDTVVVDTG